MFRFKLKGYYRIIAVVLLLVFLLNLGYFESVKTFVRAGLNPALQAVYGASGRVRDFFSGNKDSAELSSENDRLKEEASRLTAENARLQTLEEENEILRKLIDFSSKNSFVLKPANVLIENYSNASYSDVIIDKGSQDGIRDGFLAVNSAGLVVGKISNVKENISRVELATSEKCKIAATIQNEARTTGITYGELGLTVTMDFIPLTELVEEGDLAVTSGLEPGIPRGITIGRVVKVEKSNNDLWQKAIIEPMVNYSNLSIISVILGKTN